MGDEVVEALAKLLHESGRAAVEQGMVFMKGPDITPRPFAEWADLPEDAKIGRRMMAAYVIERAAEVIDLLLLAVPQERPVVEKLLDAVRAYFNDPDLAIAGYSKAHPAGADPRVDPIE